MQNETNEWLKEEQEELKKIQPSENLKPALVLEENKVVEFELVKGAEWKKYIDSDNGSVKKIIPIIHNGEEMVFFLNTANPTYKDIVERAIKGQTKFKMLRTGQKKATRYTIVE